MTVGELKTLLKRYGFDDSDPLLAWINAAIHEIENAYDRWSFLEKEEELESALRFLELEGNVKRIIKLRDITNEVSPSTGYGVDLEYMDRRAMEREFPNLTETGTYAEYFSIIGSSKLQVLPVPTSTRKYRATFYEELQDLTEDSQEPGLPQSSHYTIVRGAAYIALQAENEEERAASAQAQFEADLEKMITADRVRQKGQAGFVQDTAGYNDAS